MRFKSGSGHKTILRLALVVKMRPLITDKVELKGASVADHAFLFGAAMRGAAADSFLAHSIPTRVPVPLGKLERKLERKWKLFCL